MRLLTAACLLVMSSPSCGDGRSLPPSIEPVLTDGMRIIAFTPRGRIVIEGRRGHSRRYSGEGWTKTSTLTPRTTRWYGSLGLYDPASSISLSDRLLLDEGRQFFSTEAEALRYMKALSRHYGPLTFNKSGLVVAYEIIEIRGKRPSRALEVWQISIAGRRPTALRGGDDESIQITGGNIPEAALPLPAPVGYDRELDDEEYAVERKR